MPLLLAAPPPPQGGGLLLSKARAGSGRVREPYFQLPAPPSPRPPGHRWARRQPLCPMSLRGSRPGGTSSLHDNRARAPARLATAGSLRTCGSSEFRVGAGMTLGRDGPCAPGPRAYPRSGVCLEEGACSTPSSPHKTQQLCYREQEVLIREKGKRDPGREGPLGSLTGNPLTAVGPRDRAPSRQCLNEGWTQRRHEQHPMSASAPQNNKN